MKQPVATIKNGRVVSVAMRDIEEETICCDLAALRRRIKHTAPIVVRRSIEASFERSMRELGWGRFDLDVEWMGRRTEVRS